MDVQAMSESLNVLDLKDKTADYKKLIDYGLDSKVADKLDDIYKVRFNSFIGLNRLICLAWFNTLYMSQMSLVYNNAE